MTPPVVGSTAGAVPVGVVGPPPEGGWGVVVGVTGPDVSVGAGGVSRPEPGGGRPGPGVVRSGGVAVASCAHETGVNGIDSARRTTMQNRAKMLHVRFVILFG